jgi:hypothetical protein
MRIALLALGIGATGLGACEKSTYRDAAGPSAGRNQEPAQAPQRLVRQGAEGPSATDRPAIGGGPRVPELREITGAEAMWNIANARCDHEVLCQNIGESGKYKTREQCVAALGKDKGSNFTAQSCPNGVSDLGLSGCIRAIREEDCSGRSITRENACLAEKFCTPPAPGTAPGGPGAGSSG